MIKKFLALAFSMAGFLLVGNAYGEDGVYYCADLAHNGFKFDTEHKAYQPALFIERKFKINLDRASNRIKLAAENNDKLVFYCETPFPHKPELMNCKGLFRQFSFNSDNGRYVYSYAYGYVSDDESTEHDSLSISYGKCDKF